MKKLMIFIGILLCLNLFSTSIGWGNLQWPFSIQITAGDTTEFIYGRVWMDGVTNQPGQGAGITAEVGYGPQGSTPDSTWTWVAADYNTDVGNNDEYKQTLTVNTAGTYDYTYRYQYTGDTDWYIASERGTLTVNEQPPPTVNVTFQVDMQNQTVSENGVHLAGSFQGWDPGATEMTDSDLDEVYTVTLELTANDYHEFKYVNGNAWGSDESVPGECNHNGNRYLTVPETDTTLTVVCFGECGACTPLTNQDVTVTFQVYMGTLDPAWYAAGVSLQGSVTPIDWTPGSTLMEDGDEDLIYTVDVTFPAGTYPTVEYKFTRADSSSERTWYWEDCYNRSFEIDDSDSVQVLSVDYWNNVIPAPENVTTTIIGDDVQISWDAVPGNPLYDVYRSSDPYSGFVKINSSSLSSTFYLDEDAALETKYFYEVKAIRE